MEITKDRILKVLENVIYFPKHDNIVNLDMVKDLSIEGNKVSFAVLFPKSDDPGIKMILEASKKAIHEKIDNSLEVEITPKADEKAEKDSLSDVKQIIAVASGKGGVGKSTIAVNLAIALSNNGSKVGLLDADIYGPSIPTMLGLEGSRPYAVEEEGKSKILPLEKFGLKIVSIGFFVKPEQALIWRGPMASKALEQLFNDVKWGDLDYLIIDMPPGTGDIHLTLVQQFSVSGAVIVTTPQRVAISDVRKATLTFRQDQIKVPVLGVVENMSYFTPKELPENKYYIFGESHSEEFAKKLNIPFLGKIPVVQSISESGDKGMPNALDSDSVEGKAFNKLAINIKNKLDILNS